MKALINEVLIRYHRWRMTHAKCRSCQTVHMLAMIKRVKARPDVTIERMERNRGLR